MFQMFDDDTEENIEGSDDDDEEIQGLVTLVLPSELKVNF